MKKSFLIVSALGAIIATNGFAVGSQDVVTVYVCPEGCHQRVDYTGPSNGGTGVQTVRCVDANMNDCGKPEVHIIHTSVNSNSWAVIDAPTLKQTSNSKQVKKTSVDRAAKKIIYKEVIFDDVDSADLIEKFRMDFEM